ncbi:hypothetical protein [uncultured Tateyamaria sp.]|uniref:hypothetical protein n=1 Tax=uncultured Tateyamaria sp. TaxID=455651 RepID=UPI002621569F|nr:hypothetical protein [uncultured Tateyamaria sp.]
MADKSVLDNFVASGGDHKSTNQKNSRAQTVAPKQQAKRQREALTNALQNGVEGMWRRRSPKVIVYQFLKCLFFLDFVFQCVADCAAKCAANFVSRHDPR